MRVEAERLAKIADLIGKTNLEGMPTVIDVLDHLRRLQIRSDQWRVKFFVERCQDVSAGLIRLANDSLRWVAEIFHRRTLPQKFRVVADPEIDSGFLP